MAVTRADADKALPRRFSAARWGEAANRLRDLESLPSLTEEEQHELELLQLECECYALHLRRSLLRKLGYEPEGG